MEKKGKKYYTLNDILPDVISRLAGDRVHEQTNLENIWKEVAGDRMTGVSFSGFKNGCVFIIVDTPSRLYQWKMRKASVLRALSEKCKEIKNISFKIGKLK